MPHQVPRGQDHMLKSRKRSRRPPFPEALLPLGRAPGPDEMASSNLKEAALTISRSTQQPFAVLSNTSESPAVDLSIVNSRRSRVHGTLDNTAPESLCIT